ncbi:molybdopterin-dependent oxidoreductase [Candidatus Bathyarchaeota archaeon]|nr:molybdopterin-dependent oxidoreductase [Candidatus Bathyarchaeota archaeon]
MKKTFAGIATTITIAIVISSFAYTLLSPANSAAADPEANPTVAEWQLTVTGLVENPLNLNWTEIVAMPKSTVNAAIICVDFPSNIVEQGNWTGIKLQTLLEEAKPSAEAIKVGFYAADGYSTDLPVETAMRDDIILAYEKDGVPLNDLRLVVPGKWGYKWISQLTRIELLDYNFLGFWESRGYSDEATVSMSGQATGELPSLPTVDVPSPSPTTPATSPSPPPSQPSITSPAPLAQSTPTPEPSEGLSTPTETVYAIAASVIAVVLVFVLMFVRKRTKQEKEP